MGSRISVSARATGLLTPGALAIACHASRSAAGRPTPCACLGSICASSATRAGSGVFLVAATADDAAHAARKEARQANETASRGKLIENSPVLLANGEETT